MFRFKVFRVKGSGGGLILYLKAGHCHQNRCRSLCCPQPGNQDSSRTYSRSHRTRATVRGRAFVRDSPSLSPDRPLSQTRPEEKHFTRLQNNVPHVLKAKAGQEDERKPDLRSTC